MNAPSIWYRIAPTRWHAIAYGLGCDVIFALVGVCIWLSQPVHVTITGVAAALLTVTVDGPVHVTIIEPVATPHTGVDA